MPPWILHPADCLPCFTLISAFYITTKRAGTSESLYPWLASVATVEAQFFLYANNYLPHHVGFLLFSIKGFIHALLQKIPSGVAVNTSNNQNKLLHQGRNKTHSIFKDNKFHNFCSKPSNSYKEGSCKEMKFFNWKKSVNLSVHMPNRCTNSFCPFNSWSTKGMDELQSKKNNLQGDCV